MEDGTEKVEVPEESSKAVEATEELPKATEAAAEESVPDLMPDMEDAHAPHGHGSGVHWLDMIVGLSAMFVSVVSLWVSIEHGKTMEKMVDQNQKLVVAGTLPLLAVEWWDLDPVAYKPLERLSLRNDGVGPAIIERFEIRYKGVAQTNATILNACCAQEMGKGKYQSFFGDISGTVLPARDKRNLMTIKPLGSDAKLLRGFDKVKADISFHACYCSVLNECWETNFDHKRPQPVKECKVSPNEKLW
jgi:hypothetical protein